MKGVARCPAILIAGRMGARASVGRDEIRATLETCSGCPVTTTGGIASRHVKGQRADDPQTEPANSHPPGLATTMRMAARPSSCLQRKPAAPFDLSAAFSIRGQSRALDPRALLERVGLGQDGDKLIAVFSKIRGRLTFARRFCIDLGS